jgi:hypothetical protein
MTTEATDKYVNEADADDTLKLLRRTCYFEAKKLHDMAKKNQLDMAGIKRLAELTVVCVQIKKQERREVDEDIKGGKIDFEDVLALANEKKVKA